MIQTVEAIIDAQGNVRLLGEVHVTGQQRALVTVLEEPADSSIVDSLFSQSALNEDWGRPEEEAAWSHLQPGR